LSNKHREQEVARSAYKKHYKYPNKKPLNSVVFCLGEYFFYVGPADPKKKIKNGAAETMTAIIINMIKLYLRSFF
jgi:hypothetical protein